MSGADNSSEDNTPINNPDVKVKSRVLWEPALQGAKSMSHMFDIAALREHKQIVRLTLQIEIDNIFITS